MSRPPPDVLADERAWYAATTEVIEAARIVVRSRDLMPSDDAHRLVFAVAAMEKLEQEAAKRIEIERAQQRGA